MRKINCTVLLKPNSFLTPLLQVSNDKLQFKVNKHAI